MKNGSSTPSTIPETSSPDFSFMDELLDDGFWLEANDGSDFWQPGPPTFDFPSLDTYIDSSITAKSIISDDLNLSNNLETDEFSAGDQSTRLWFGPNRNPTGTISVKKRLIQAIDRLRDSIIDKDILVQIWIPIKSGDRQVLTTNGQPFSLNPHCKNLADYRNVSENYQFSTDADAKELFGLPGRVFLNKLPDWTPDVRFFKREEYPRVNHAQEHGVRGSLALPVFEHGSGICLGVVEIVTTSQKINFSPELENVCKALEAVNLKSSNILRPSNIEDPNEPYQDSLTEIKDVLKFICDAHKLPLAQTWASCVQRRKSGCRHSDENYSCCVSTVDSACYVADEQVSGFHEACSGYHLLKGEGVVGKAFLTNEPYFSEDITAYSKTEYPLAHHARVFKLCASGAIRLRSTNNRADDFVLELFLPLNCRDGASDQKLMLNSLTSFIIKTCGTLRLITDDELAREILDRERGSSVGKLGDENHQSPPDEHDVSSWIMNVMDAEHEGEGGNVSLANQKEGLDEESNIWETLEHDGEGSGDFSLTKTSSEKRRTKIKKTIGLEVLRQYYAGSLKEAAMSIGVCPTTLKRICRQHGITRWPSRKIKKVGHSLRKLEVVLNSVQGAEGSVQLDSFYNNFPELVPPNSPGSRHLSTSKTGDHTQQVKNNQPEGTTNLCSPASESPSSPSNHSCNSSCHCSTEFKKSSLLSENAGKMLKRAQSEARLHENDQGNKTKFLIRSYRHKNSSNNSRIKSHPAVEKNRNQTQEADILRVKAAFGEEKVRFRLQQQWGFEDLQNEVFRRFNIENGSSFSLKYLDDDAEWVLLTCDDDLDECRDVYRSSGSRIIKLSVNQTYHPQLGRNEPTY